MINCLKNRLFRWSVALGIAFSATACTPYDDTFGDNFIPVSQLMGSEVDSNMLVRTYIDTWDSTETSNVNFVPYLGAKIDPQTGRSTFSFFANYAPFGFKELDGYGAGATADSLVVILTFIEVGGDATQTYTVDMYEVNGFNACKDSTYYNNFDITPYIGAQPLHSFQQTGAGRVSFKLPLTFAEKLIDSRYKEENAYYTDTTFHRHYNGMYFKVREEITSGEGTYFRLDLGQSVMNVFYKNDKIRAEGGDRDSSQRLMFYDPNATLWNTNIQLVEHDYSLADPAQGGVPLAAIGDRTNESQYVYIKGFASLKGWIDLNEASFERIKDQAEAQGYSRVAIHKAKLEFDIVKDNWEEYFRSFSALGVYYNLMKKEFLVEYNPVLAQVQTSGYTPTLGGSLNHSRGKYTFDITTYVQQLFTGATDKFSTELLPAYGLRNETGRTWLYGSASSRPPKLVIVYTMIR